MTSTTTAGARRAGRRRPASSAGGRAVLPTHPAWGIAFIGVAAALVCLSDLVVLVATGRATLLTATTLLLVVGVGVSLGLGRGWLATRWNGWMCHVAVQVGIGSSVALILVSPDQATAVAHSITFCWAAVFGGLYLRAPALAGHVALGALVTTAAAGTVGAQAQDAVLSIVAPVALGMGLLTVRLAGLLNREAQRDTLTGALNRRGLYQAAAVLRPRRNAGTGSVAVLDLDAFKAVNDTHGHEAGDALLTEAVTAWQQVLAPDELLARTGGDEFVVLSPAGAPALQETVARLRAACPPTVGVSAGIAGWVPGSDLDAALRIADRGVYQAKAAGGRRTVLVLDDQA